MSKFTDISKTLIIAIMSFLLYGCMSEPKDGLPKDHGKINLSKIKSPEPKKEPKSKYGNPKEYVVFDKKYNVLDTAYGYTEIGLASWYGTKFHGKRTSSGEPYDMYSMVAAHKHLPLPTYAKVTNLENGKEIIVKIIDRGPFKDDRVIDLSYVAAAKLGIIDNGTAIVKIEAINP